MKDTQNSAVIQANSSQRLELFYFCITVAVRLEMYSLEVSLMHEELRNEDLWGLK